MKRILLLVAVLLILIQPVYALERNTWTDEKRAVIEPGKLSSGEDEGAEEQEATPTGISTLDVAREELIAVSDPVEMPTGREPVIIEEELIVRDEDDQSITDDKELVELPPEEESTVSGEDELGDEKEPAVSSEDEPGDAKESTVPGEDEPGDEKEPTVSGEDETSLPPADEKELIEPTEGDEQIDEDDHVEEVEILEEPNNEEETAP